MTSPMTAPYPPVIAIVGATGTGKSALTVRLAHHLAESGQPAEIINADAFSLYRGMDIGTAKITAEEQEGVPHHLLDILDPAEDASVADYQELGRTIIDDIRHRGGRPIVVGGSGLYVRALLDHLNFPGTDPHVREALEARADREGSTALHAELAHKDPVSAERIDHRNLRRVIRALEVIELTGEPFSANLPEFVHAIDAIQIGIQVPYDVLDPRLEQRVDRMWERGFIAEVERLRDRMGRTAARAVGYAQVLQSLAGEITEAQAYEATVTATRRLARRQMTWFGRDPRTMWIDITQPDAWSQVMALMD